MLRRDRNRRGGLAAWRLPAAVACSIVLAAVPVTALAAGPAAELEFEVDWNQTAALDVLAGLETGWRLEDAGPAANGQVSLPGTGIIRYTPTANFSGVDSFPYVASGPDGERVDGTVTVFVFAETEIAPEPVAAVAEPEPARAAVAADATAAGAHAATVGPTWRWVVRVGLVAAVLAIYLLARKKSPAT